MRNKEEIKEVLDYFQAIDHKELKFDEEAILAAYQKNDGHQSLAIKILSIFGGISAGIVFLGALFITGIYDSDSGLLIFGILAVIGGLLINKIYDKIIIDTLSVSSYIIGFILLGVGLIKMEMSENTVCFLFILIAFASLLIVRTYIISFISVLIINGAIVTLIVSNNNFSGIQIYTSFLGIIVTALFLKEAKIISMNTAFSKLYNPVRIGLLFSFLAGLVLLGKSNIINISRDYLWVSSVIIILIILYVLSYLFDVLNISSTKQKGGIYVVSLFILLTTLLSPAISGAILIILLSFLVNYKTSLVMGIIAFIYFVSQYYYDLHFTLLTKSIFLFSSGVLFLVLYLLTRKKLTSNEKV
ncbi:hypothetical protein M2347_000775 [Chryseobacterium sp. H1D6B]|uniref:DUF4401 domain-containing protein n=1 Tax=Chryseobacterium sp. H1D6B TaxID=2940588 RepID=UPI0015CAA016|nr:DUF4401 domain-containing protein [Chryseobacterium sp. H1D6B]MDH6251048.1 hypothetical protein [Chryseobacterium sp. H1D6B]